MAFYADLGPIDYFRAAKAGATWRAVGWLERNHPFIQGEVDETFVRRLEQLMKNAPQRIAFFGSHGCQFCQDAGVYAGMSFKEMLRSEYERGATGHQNLWIPGNGVIYVAPFLVLHYIREHQYRPPDEFIGAVLRCPDTTTSEYGKAMASIDPLFEPWSRKVYGPES